MKRSALVLSPPFPRSSFCVPAASARPEHDSAQRRRRLRTLRRCLSLLLVALWTVSSLCLIHARQQEKRHMPTPLVVDLASEP